ncbi:MAG: hypothetical protein HXX15_02135 [Rhodopseudomonas sp.]|uniref:hypothetical protein n=1 Tax=Rhodopseudomonas sp. TaxID=1078 RepID=UPI00183291EC|nr:hypothetical protein [Rhodopseudomonas sp.]NVN84864.1 hypothetical protein [Rhodopseudomonas sp.]
MTQSIIRTFETLKQITGVEADLTKNNFTSVQVFPNATVPNRGTVEELTNAIAKTGIVKYQAASFAEIVKRGGAVVIVQAHFGTGAKASEILGKYNPIKATVASSDPLVWDDAAPFSSLLHIPVLLDSSGSYHSYSGTPLLIDQDGEYKSMSGTPLILEQKGAYQSMSGTPLLIEQKGEYKSMSGTPLLIEQKGEYKSYSGTPLLLNNPTPLSSWLGFPALSK